MAIFGLFFIYLTEIYMNIYMNPEQPRIRIEYLLNHSFEGKKSQ